MLNSIFISKFFNFHFYLYPMIINFAPICVYYQLIKYLRDPNEIRHL